MGAAPAGTAATAPAGTPTDEELVGALRGLGLTPFAAAMALEYVHRHGGGGGGSPCSDGDDDTPAATAAAVAAIVVDKVAAAAAGITRRWLAELARAAASSGDGVAETVRRPPSPWQRGCPELLPGLTSRAFWYRGPARTPVDTLPRLLHWIRDLEASTAAIRAEALALRGGGGFQRYRAPTWAAGVAAEDGGGGVGGVDAGDWHVYYLYLHNADYADNRARCPVTSALLAALPRHYCHAMFSALAPHTHVTTHTGATNRKLRLQLPLVVPRHPPACCRLRAGREVHALVEGEAFMFDDSYQHEAWNDGDTPRLVLILDVWHPDLTDADVKVLSFIHAAQMRAAKAASATGALPPAADFYGILAAGRARPVDEAAIFGEPGAGPVDDGCSEGDAALRPLAAAPVRDD